MKIFIIKNDGHLGYEQCDVIGETKKKYKLHAGSIDKDKAYLREIDAVNARIARSADLVLFYEGCVDKEKQRLKTLIERIKYI